MALKNEVEITITGRQYFSAGDLLSAHAQEVEEILFPAPCEREVELSTDGEMEVSSEGVFISYDESECTGLEGCRTTFSVRDDMVCLSRTGRIESHLVFEKGKRFQLFHGPSPAPVSVRCHDLRHSVGASCGIIHIDYSLEIAGNVVEHNAYQIRVHPTDLSGL